jgi:putative membrane protein
MNARSHLSEAAWLAIVGAVLVWSWIGAYDPGVWVMEVLPVFIAVPVLAFTRSRFPLTPLVYALILVHAIILMVGGHYTYARVPLGFWLQEWFDFSRNHYDRIGHLAQGFIPAMVAREILLRQTPLKPGGWLFFLVTSVCLAISAVYEFIEWWAALALGAGADEFLATQGDPFDTQADMLMATLGAMLAQVLLARWHDRQLAVLRR